MTPDEPARPGPGAPRRSLDPRFSDHDAEPTTWSQVESILESAELAWIATVRGDGRPHVTPLVTVWHDDALHFATGPEEQKALNLRHNDRVALTTGCAEWRSGVDIVVHGRASRVTDLDVLERLTRAWQRRWDGRWAFAAVPEGFGHAGGGTALVYAVRPQTAIAFEKGQRYGQTTFRFA